MIAFIGGSKASTSMSNPCARLCIACPIRPKPTTPSTFRRSSPPGLMSAPSISDGPQIR